LQSACEKAISIIHQILLKTIEFNESLNTANTCGNELSLIESKTVIEAAETLFHAVLINEDSI